MLPGGRGGEFIIVAAIATGVMSYTKLNVPDPIAVAAAPSLVHAQSADLVPGKFLPFEQEHLVRFHGNEAGHG